MNSVNEVRLAVRSLRLGRRQQTLADELTFSVRTGETLAVMGRSGAGKTTLLRTIAGLTPPEAGVVERQPGRVPIIFQEPRLLPWRTTIRNIELVLAEQERDRAGEWLALVGLADVAKAYPLTLSGGMKQRVSIARALACHAPLLLVDEPFSHLDVVTAHQLRDELTAHLASTGTSAVWVTHDPAEAVAVASRTLVMAGPPHGSWELVDHRLHAGPDATARHLARTIGEISNQRKAS